MSLCNEIIIYEKRNGISCARDGYCTWAGTMNVKYVDYHENVNTFAMR